jgi:hypothetical protein
MVGFSIVEDSRLPDLNTDICNFSVPIFHFPFQKQTNSSLAAVSRETFGFSIFTFLALRLESNVYVSRETIKICSGPYFAASKIA